MTWRLLTLSEACKGLCIHPNTLRRWGRQGRLGSLELLVEGEVPEGKVKRLVGIIRLDVPRRAVVYCRFSSHDRKQKGGMERQKENLLEYARSKGYDVVSVLGDVASGLNRRSLNRLFDMVERREIEVVIVGYKDRLTRFGFRYLERYFASHGVRIEVVNGEEPKSEGL